MDGEVGIHLADAEVKESPGRFGNQHGSAFAARGPWVAVGKIVQNKANFYARERTISHVEEKGYDCFLCFAGPAKQSQFWPDPPGRPLWRTFMLGSLIVPYYNAAGGPAVQGTLVTELAAK